LSAQPFHRLYDKLLADEFDAPIKKMHFNG
jgi:hypothetical protein